MQALTATFLDLKTSFPLPSCGQLKEMPSALTSSKKEKKNSDGAPKICQALYWMLPVPYSFSEGVFGP